MAYDSFNVASSGSSAKSRACNRNLIIISVIVAAIGLGGGILIGHFAIEKTSSDHGGRNGQTGVWLEGVSEAIVREANPSVTDWILEGINNNNIETYLRNLSANPHIAGTPQDFEQADMLRQFWLDAGLDHAATTPYDILLSYPSDSEPNILSLIDTAGNEVMASPEREANLTSEDSRDDFPFPYLGYSGNGTVHGTIIYVNYGRESDFRWLEQQNILVAGQIVMARYGKGGRSGKVKRAEERGAIGVVLYSDPADYIAANATSVYPDSWWIPPSAASRGTISRGTGDPLTPGYPAISSAYRYSEANVKPALPNIPAMPIGYDFAEKIMQELGGDDVPDGWTGRLNVTYKIGGSFRNTSLRAQLSVHTRNERRIAYNAFGVIKGEVEPDRYVMLGNHRDSWVLGAIDPSSGTATMMELSRVLGQLVKENTWRPRRSIIFCSWGAEEFGLIGSTEWVELYLEGIFTTRTQAINTARTQASFQMKNKSIVEMREKVPVGVVEESDDLLVNVIQNMLVFYDLYGAGSVMENINTLDSRAVAYINMDIAVTGNYTVRGLGSPPVFRAMYSAAAKVTNPDNTDTEFPTVFDSWTERRPLLDPETQSPTGYPVINTPGGGSDYGTFMMFAGITCADFRYDYDFAGEDLSFYPLYHTVYETFYAVRELMDPGLVYHGTVAKLSGELLRDLADSKILPFNMTDYYLILNQYRVALKNHSLDSLTQYEVNMTQLDEVIELYRQEAAIFQNSLGDINTNNPFELRRVNDQMMQIDRAFLDPAGLPSRSQDNYYRNVVHSNTENSYPVSSFPGITDALFKLQDNPNDAALIEELRHHFSVVVFTIQSAAYSLKDTVSFLRTTY